MGSKQSYYTARLMVDRNKVDDCFRAYAYFRWADDVVDDPLCSNDTRISFINRQRELIESLYAGEWPESLTIEEEIIADLISNNRSDSDGLRSFIENFLAVIEFDAHRKGRVISQKELDWYSGSLGKSVTDGIQYFIGNGAIYPEGDNRYLAATAAHITHMLRDMVQDVAEGFINIPGEYLEEHDLKPGGTSNPIFKTWVRAQVELARRYFLEGKEYLDELNVLRCKIVAYWYCARFERVLDMIQADDYELRPEYNERRRLGAWIHTAWLAAVITIKHFAKHILPQSQFSSARD